MRLNGGQPPDPGPLNRRIIRYFYLLHTSRTKDFPGAWTIAFQRYDIEVGSDMEADLYLRAWDLLYAAINRIQHERSRRDADRRHRELAARKPLKTE